MYIGHGHLCVRLSVPYRVPTLLHRPRCNLGEWQECPLVVHYWANLQSVHGFRCYDNAHVYKLIALYTANAYSTKHKMSSSACTRCMAGLKFAGLVLASDSQNKGSNTSLSEIWLWKKKR